MQLEHANITVKSLDESIRLLKTAFPQAEIRGQGSLHGGSKGGRWAHFGNASFYVALQENAQHSARQDMTYEHDGINHIGFVVTDLDDLIARMTAQGYSMTPASALDSHPARRRAYFFDGNAIEWEFVEYLTANAEQRNDYRL